MGVTAHINYFRRFGRFKTNMKGLYGVRKPTAYEIESFGRARQLAEEYIRIAGAKKPARMTIALAEWDQWIERADWLDSYTGTISGASIKGKGGEVGIEFMSTIMEGWANASGRGPASTLSGWIVKHPQAYEAMSEVMVD